MYKKNIKSEYQAPQAEVIEARVERGFAVSGEEPQEDPVTDGSTLGAWGSTGTESYFGDPMYN